MTASDDCEVTGKDYVLISEGEYVAQVVSWETSTRFGRKVKDHPDLVKGGKVYLWFRVDPYRDKLSEEVQIFMPLNAATVQHPAGESGKFKVGARSKYFKTLKRLYGENAAKFSRSPKTLMQQLFIVRVRTVTQDDRQKNHHEHERYSVIEEIIELA